ncbi:MAG: NfeD family protein, partial [Sphingopyxis sp.]|nr:NfeD family protein [Sphingopyxis sp.]
MPDWLANMEPHWAWLSLGVLLAAAEIVAPGFFLIWVGAAAVVTGVIAWVVPLSIPLQLGIFAILSFVALYGGPPWPKGNPIPPTGPPPPP